jgi:voltage-gated potassium channel
VQVRGLLREPFPGVEDVRVVAAVRNRTFAVLDVAADGDVTSRFVDVTIMTLIVANVLAVMLETVPSVHAAYHPHLWSFNLFCVLVFTVEYIMRVWSCTSDPQYAHPVWGRLRFMCRPMILIDLLAILPFYLPLLFAMDMQVLRMLRLFRLIRVFKLARYWSALRLMGAVLSNKKAELVVGFAIMGMVLIFAASLMHVVEHRVQPEAFGSIPQAMWWAVATLTTVGYGDVYPITALGKLGGALVALVGVGMFAMPAGIISQGFADECRKRRGKRAPLRCPHCANIVHGRREIDVMPDED